jgi:YfiH family protein
VYLKQVHGTHVVDAAECGDEPEADASISRLQGMPAMVMTADCLPVLFCNDRGSCVAAAHAGWKGLLAGVLENTVSSMDCYPLELMAWLGPAISQPCFEVGSEVRDAFVDANNEAEKGFILGNEDRWLADLYLLARQRLYSTGITRVYGGNFCTFTQDKLFLPKVNIKDCVSIRIFQSTFICLIAYKNKNLVTLLLFLLCYLNIIDLLYILHITNKLM